MLLFQSLASGSSGNSYLLRTEKTTLLVDAGLRLSTLVKYLAAEGIAPSDLTAILISHEHRDHCAGARELAEEHRAPVWSNAAVLQAAGLHDLDEAHILDVGVPVLFGDVEVICFPVQHDSVCPVGFMLRVAGRTITIATDLGQADDDVTSSIAEADLVVLESNHDVEMLERGRYPYHLRRRVSGPNGHLSNSQAGTLIARHVKDEATEVWLAHLSKHNNRPEVALRTVRAALRQADRPAPSLAVALRDRPSLRWNGHQRPRQLSLFGAELEPA